MKPKLKIGIVGMGFIADYHFRGFKQNPDAEIIGMAQDFYGNENKVEQMRNQLHKKCSEWNIKAYSNFNEIVEDPAFDVLIIGSINRYHFGQIKKGIASKKHLLVEKPVVTDFLHLKIIRELSSQSTIKIFPAHNFVYRKAVIKAKELFCSLGDPIII